MNLWQFVTAREIKFVDHCHQEIIQFLEQLTEDHLFLPETWKRLTAFVRVIPDGDILPTRGRYSSTSNDWQVAVNHLYESAPDDSLWFSLPDVVASVILTGRIPRIADAFRIEPSGEMLEGLTSTKLRGKQIWKVTIAIGLLTYGKQLFVIVLALLRLKLISQRSLRLVV